MTTDESVSLKYAAPSPNVINAEARERELNRDKQARWRERNRDEANRRSREAMRRKRAMKEEGV